MSLVLFAAGDIVALIYSRSKGAPRGKVSGVTFRENLVVRGFGGLGVKTTNNKTTQTKQITIRRRSFFSMKAPVCGLRPEIFAFPSQGRRIPCTNDKKQRSIPQKQTKGKENPSSYRKNLKKEVKTCSNVPS
tara:strand:- start:3174 stop:3569 length:396 start_codon:yes stop_codon:yes gene_type:complete